MKEQKQIFLKSTSDTKILANKIARFAKKNFFLCLYGDLGSGKTTFAKYFINSLSKKKQNVQSPTFTMVKTYELSKHLIWHFDLYRLTVPDEIFNLDFEIAVNDIVIVEWPEIIKDYLPENRIEIFLSEDSKLRRFANLNFFGSLKKVGDLFS